MDDNSIEVTEVELMVLDEEVDGLDDEERLETALVGTTSQLEDEVDMLFLLQQTEFLLNDEVQLLELLERLFLLLIVNNIFQLQHTLLKLERITILT